MKSPTVKLLKRTYPQPFLEEQLQNADSDLVRKIVGMAHIERPKLHWPHLEVAHDPTISAWYIYNENKSMQCRCN